MTYGYVYVFYIHFGRFVANKFKWQNRYKCSMGVGRDSETQRRRGRNHAHISFRYSLNSCRSNDIFGWMFSRQRTRTNRSNWTPHGFFLCCSCLFHLSQIRTPAHLLVPVESNALRTHNTAHNIRIIGSDVFVYAKRISRHMLVYAGCEAIERTIKEIF